MVSLKPLPNALSHQSQEKHSSLTLSSIRCFAEGERHYNMESLYDYGSRAGFWRLHRLFTKKKIPCTVFAVGMALERNPSVCLALRETPSWEVASHGYRWIDYQNVDEDTERDHIARTVHIHERLLGKRPVGMYQGKVCGNQKDVIVWVFLRNVESTCSYPLLPRKSQMSTHENLWSKKVASSTILIRTPMTCPTGRLIMGKSPI